MTDKAVEAAYEACRGFCDDKGYIKPTMLIHAVNAALEVYVGRLALDLWERTNGTDPIHRRAWLMKDPDEPDYFRDRARSILSGGDDGR